MKLAKLEKRCVYLEGKRRTEGFILCVYFKDVLKSRLNGYREMTGDKMKSKQDKRRQFYLSTGIGLIPDYFNSLG